MEIQDYPNYLIHDDGRVWSKPRKDSRGCQVKGGFLKHVKTQAGYHRVYLCRDGKGKYVPVSRLVALHYLPNPENKSEVDHIDRDKDNNHISNLRWATRQENCDNRGMPITNTSGHEYISYDKSNNMWRFAYRNRGHRFRKSFKTKQDAIHYKFFFLLKLKSGRV